MAVDGQTLAQQFEGRRLAELILSHVNSQDGDQCRAALVGLLDELPIRLHEPVMDLTDFCVAMPQDQLSTFFAGDCGSRFLELMDVAKGYLHKNYGLQISQDDAFTIFNILIVNYAVACHAHPQTKAAMKKAAGIGFLGRLLGR